LISGGIFHGSGMIVYRASARAEQVRLDAGARPSLTSGLAEVLIMLKLFDYKP
jgi:hypothetical protein